MAESEQVADTEAGAEAPVDMEATGLPESPAVPETPVQGGRNARKSRVGVIASDAADKTVTVVVERRFAHPLYGKQMARTKKYHAHDEGNEYRVGDVVRIVETRPLSKTKRWRVVELLERPA